MTSPSPAVPAPLEVVRAAYAAFRTSSIPDLFALLAPDTVWTMNGPPTHPYAGTFEGPDGVRAFLVALGSTVEVLDFGADEEHVSGDVVTCVGHERLRVRATGRLVENRWIHVVRVRRGKIVRMEEWTDTATFLAALVR